MKRLSIGKIAGLFVISAIGMLSSAPDTCAQAPNNLQAAFDNFNQNALTEKIYAHTDKSFYVVGEIMWFKLYSVDGTYNKPLNLSKVAYVEVLDENNTPVLQGKISLNKGSGSGSFNIPFNLLSGNYKFRTYTSWMKNFGPEHFFEKHITIANSTTTPEKANAGNKPGIDVQFFAEGGHLVADLPSKVAFKVTGTNGKGVNFKSAIVTERNDTVARLEQLKFGMGSGAFTPRSGIKYRSVTQANGLTIVKDIPVEQKGYTLRLEDSSAANLAITLSTNVDNGEGSVYLIAHTGQAVKAAQGETLNGGKATFVVNKSRLGDGVSHITVFNAAGQPLCERLYFKRPAKTFTIQPAGLLAQYSTRNRVEISFTALNKSNQPVTTDLSMAVYQLDSLQKPDEADISSYLWLASDLKGYIESPGYYLSNTDVAANAALDNLMLTQGWSRFAWNDVLKQNKPALTFLPELEGHLITGKVTDKITGQPVNNVISYLSVPGTKIQYYAGRSDSTGRILFNTRNFFGAAEAIVQANTEKDSTTRIDILSPFAEQYTATMSPQLSLSQRNESALRAHILDMQVNRVYNGDNLRRYYASVSDSSAFYGNTAKSYRLDDYKRFTTMEEVLREYVSEVNILRQQKRFRLRILNENGFLEGPEPVVLLDGVPIFNTDKAAGIDPLKVKRLDVIPRKYIYGPAEHNGILSFVTYKGDLGGFEIDPRAVVLDYEGLQLQREFYSPVYQNEDQQISRLPDFRNVLYWSPMLSTSKEGKGEVSFYTSDKTGKFIGVVQGLSADGSTGSRYFTFEVKK